MYTRADLKLDAGLLVHGTVDNDGTTTKLDRLTDMAVEDVINDEDIDLRSTTRLVQLALAGQDDLIYDETAATYDTPSLIAVGAQAYAYEYLAPYDLKGEKIIDIRERSGRTKTWERTTAEQFDVRKTAYERLFALRTEGLVRKLLVNGVTSIDTTMIHDCDSLTDNGTIAAVGDAASIAIDTESKLEGLASISFASGTGGTTSGIKNSTITAVDLSAYTTSNVFAWVYIPSSFDLTKLTSFTMDWGSDASNYYSNTVIATHEMTAFHSGWNLLRFNWSEATTTGNPVSASIGYFSLYMTKNASYGSVAGFHVDRIIAAIDSGFDVPYYSKFGWRNSSGVWMQRSTQDSDILNADSDEYNLMKFRAALLYAINLENEGDINRCDALYADAKKQYMMNHPSEAKLLTTSYHDTASTEVIQDYRSVV